MKRMANTVLTLAIMLPMLAAPSFAGGKAIYGEDDRIDLYDASPEEARLADSVVSFWKYNQYTAGPEGISLKTVEFADEFSLCPGERFREQQEGAFCSGFLVGEDLVLTAGHCIIDQECEGTNMVFGFAVREAGGKAPAAIGNNDVYSCKEIVSRTAPAGLEPGLDYALVRLDRPVVGHKPLAVNRRQNIKEGAKVTVIGHPLGLPLKIGTGSVRDASPDIYFLTDLDTFVINSGSPVFNTATGLVEGILVRGDKDFRRTPDGCSTVVVFPQDGGAGEGVTRISAIGSLIPKLAE